MKKALIFGLVLIPILFVSYLLVQQKKSLQVDNSKALATYFTIPESTTTVNINLETGYTVEYTEGEGEYVEHGVVTFLKDFVEPITDKDYVTIVAVDRGGSGTEIYLTIFTLGETGNQSIATVFLGDRVKIDSLSVGVDNKITVTYKQHGENQAMAEEPTIVVEKTFSYQELLNNNIKY